MTMKRALVTGAAGFIGRNMTRHLIQANYVVVQVDPAFQNTTPELEDNHVYPWDMRAYLSTKDHREEFDLVVHAAAMEPNRKAIDTKPAHFPENVHIDASLFRWAHIVRPGRIVYLSSSAAYPRSLQYAHQHTRLQESHMDGRDADAVYGVAKVLGEDLARNYQNAGGVVTIVRPFSGYGPDQSTDFPFGALVERVRRREAPVKIWGDGRQVRDFIHVDDLCRATLALVDADVIGAVNLGTGIATSMTGLVRLAAQIDGFKDVEIEPDLSEPAGVAYRVADISRLSEHYTPRWTLAAGIAQRLSRPPM